MAGDNIWEFLQFVDQMHTYLLFLNVLGVYLIARLFVKNKFIVGFFVSLSFLITFYMVLTTNNITLASLEGVVGVIFLNLPLIVFIIFKKFLPYKKNLKIFEKVILWFAVFFFYTQAILGGCFIYYIQNEVAKNNLRLDNWKLNTVFGSEILSGSAGPLRLLYFFIASGILYKITNPKFVKNIFVKFKKRALQWHQKSIDKI